MIFFSIYDTKFMYFSANTVSQSADWTVTPTSSLMSSSPPMVNSACLDHGTVLSVCGIWPQATPLVASSATPRTFSPSPSPLTTVRSSPPPVIAPSSCGILWVFASTPSKNRVTPSGSPVSDSHHWPRTQLLSHLDGINWSRFGICPTASSSVTTTATLATWTPLPSHPMVPSALPVVATVS